MKQLLILFALLIFGMPALAYSQSEASDKLAEKLIPTDNIAFFMNAINKKDYEVCQLFIDLKTIDLDKKAYGSYPLTFAIVRNSPQIAELLLKSGAKPHFPDLFFATKKGYTGVVQEILKTPDLNIKRERPFFRVPLITTAHNKGNKEIEEMLINYKNKYESSSQGVSKQVETIPATGFIAKPKTKKEASPSNTAPYMNEAI